MTPLVSVVIPTHNRRDPLRAAIRSVLAQTVRDIEVIVADDASTEDVGSLVKEFRDPRVRCVRRSSNGGDAAARNAGIRASSGRFVAFWMMTMSGSRRSSRDSWPLSSEAGRSSASSTRPGRRIFRRRAARGCSRRAVTKRRSFDGSESRRRR